MTDSHTTPTSSKAPSSSEHHESLGQKLKTAIIGSHSHSETKSPSAISSQKHVARSEHERLEAEADARIHEREVEEAREGAHPFVPPTVNEGRLGLDEAAHGPPVAQGSAGVHRGEPDLVGGTHIPETQLPQRHHETQHTALRPSDPYDQTAMDGAVVNETSAGDDYTL